MRRTRMTDQQEHRISSVPVANNPQSHESVSNPSIPLLLQRAQNQPTSLTPGDVLHLQRTLGNQATVGLFSQQAEKRDRKPGSIQRELHGTDPLEKYAQGGDKSLLYGLSPFRARTENRLGIQDQEMDEDQPIRSIDTYNTEIGFNAAMTTRTSAFNIFLVREALNDPDPVKNWGTYFPSAAKKVSENPDLQLWIKKLAKNVRNIGLYDLGDQKKVGFLGFRKRKGAKKIKSKDRLLKNAAESNFAQQFDPKDLNWWLRPDQTRDQAQIDANNISSTKMNALHGWVYIAFFRRTSKLGINFAITDLKSGVNFNNAAAVDYYSDNPELRKIVPGGIGLSSKLTDQSVNRPITTSEYRHIKKYMKKGKIKANKVNFYDEF